MNTKHTPGPWEVYGDNSTLIGADDDKMMLAIANYKHATHPEWDRPIVEARANARLIAAAPELLAACKAILEGGNVDCGTYWRIDISDIDKIRAAIAKAEGQL